MTELTSDLRVPAAQYIRMSTEHQRYSLENQIAAIGEYANNRGFAIVDTYADAGKSGLTLKGRDGLKQLLADVVTGQHTYSAVLVLDVSRWGRFQDTDQSAHYEFLCRNSGVAVVYCAEPFENDGSMVSTILKNMKRAMASEFSRELSFKVSRAHRQQAVLGFSQGGVLQYGVRRLLVNKDREPLFLLKPGERKGLSSDRVLLVPGPPNEISVVQRIFDMFVNQKRSMSRISISLNQEGLPSTNGRVWNHRRVKAVLSNELMIGYYVYNRRSYLLKGRPKRNPPEQWTRARVMDPIVDLRQFDKAQRELRCKRGYGYERPRMVKCLQRLFKEKKKLTVSIINACPYTPAAAAYVAHFGSLRAAYAAVGYKQCSAPPKADRHYSDEELLDCLRRLHNAFGYVTVSHINADPELPRYQAFLDRFGTMRTAYSLAGLPATNSELISAGLLRATLRREKDQQGGSGRRRGSTKKGCRS